MILDVSDIVADFITETATVTRAAATTYDANGRAVAGSSSTFAAGVCVQPVTGKDLLRLEEGFRTRDARAVFSTVELRSAAAGGAPADLVQLADGTFEVQHVEPWDSGAFWRCIVLRVQA